MEQEDGVFLTQASDECSLNLDRETRNRRKGTNLKDA